MSISYNNFLISACDENGHYYEYSGKKFREAGSYWTKTENPGLFRHITTYKQDKEYRKPPLFMTTGQEWQDDLEK